MRIRRKRTSERGLSQEAQGGKKKKYLSIEVGFVYLLQNMKTVSLLFVCPDERQGHRHHGEGRQRSGKGNAVPRAPQDANPVQLVAVHPHHH